MSGYPVLKDSAAKLYFLMYDSAQSLPVGKADLVVGNITVTIKKLGGAWGAASGAVTNEGEGWYSVAHVANTDTVGPLLLKASAAGAVTALHTFNIVAYNSADAEDLGLSAVAVAAAQATAASDFSEANNTMLGTMPADVWDHSFGGDMARNWILGTNNLLILLEARLTLNAIRDAVLLATTSSLTVPGSFGAFVVTLLQAAHDRVILGVPSSAPGAVSGVVIRSYLDQRTSASTGTMVSAFLSMVENYSGALYRFLAPALALAPSGGGGGGGGGVQLVSMPVRVKAGTTTRMTQGDAFTRQVRLMESNDEPFPIPGGATVEIIWTRVGQNVPTLEAEATIDLAAQGLVSYPITAPDTATPGNYREQWRVTSGATVLMFPTVGYVDLVIKPA